MKYAIVIGSNFGDEGKGLMTDYLSKRLSASYVARFNGGVQAGHTVVRGNKRFVFGAYGSGTLQGIETILTDKVILNPFAALHEQDMMFNQGITSRRIHVSRNSPITTPFDVAINKEVELSRGSDRHGSCGAGINETITRHLDMQYRSVYPALFDDTDSALHWIRDMWVPRRMTALGLSFGAIKRVQEKGDSMIEAFRTVMQRAKTEVYRFDKPQTDHHIVYEGAQGLALDEYMGKFPHVTRSNTGISNALDHISQIADPLRKTTVVGVYVTRCYTTRHGAGPLAYEMPVDEVLCGNHIVDQTNVYNDWQQTLRYAPLHLPSLVANITADIERNASKVRDYGFKFTPAIALTCADQSDKFRVVCDDRLGTQWLSSDEIARRIETALGIDVAWISYGPSADDVVERLSMF